ncbi:TPA: hypothetical protein DCW38_02430 [candidate division WOR-3 bacterium]|uniref:HIT family protein n=1 Tax=candidate division WOR-3 bacterium TaxID=2052148 RepID=A0A350H904_UNCW3|nr:hypothetical protein [candidate division WOR-3 bacterium]
MECYSCKSNSGEKRISPGVPIYLGKYWRVEHSYPTGLEGWLVIVLNRHCEALHELSLEEWKELYQIQYHSIRVLYEMFSTKKEYLCCFAEMDGFEHIHFHVIPKSNRYNEEWKGFKAFQYLKMDKEKNISEDRIKEICTILAKHFSEGMLSF